MKRSIPKARQKRLASVAAGLFCSAVGLYKFVNGAYTYAVGSAGLGLIYLWLAIKNVAKLDANLEQSLSELSDALPDTDDNLDLNK